MPRPGPVLRGRAVTAAVAAGALAVAGHTMQATTAGQYKQVAEVAPAALTGPSLASEVLQLDLTRDAPTGVAALRRAVERADRAAAYQEALGTRLGRPYQAGNSHSLDGWIAKALGIMGLPQALLPGVKQIIMHESGGIPNAINNWDSNAKAGIPSQGLMQTIPSTFRACVLPSLADRPITDPVANITAGIRSMVAHHGLSTVMNGGRRDANGNYIGYGGAGCPSYNLNDYASQLRDLWKDEPLPAL
ncbi:MAG: transglycosylase SLT domain-containing protein [Actinomycetota bacterium]|nr:transglycosylase SLT domain-containing protein [Actinomycetota bacterium]